MPVDYRKQYRSEQLEPLWPNALIRGAVAALCTLAVMIVLAVLPVVLNQGGAATWMADMEPADPRATPTHIRPEWYFLANYQALKVFPSELLGVSGKVMGVISQGVIILAVILLPFWSRRRSKRRSGMGHAAWVTVVIGIYLALTLWAAAPLTPFVAITSLAIVVTFYVLLASERRRIRRIMGESGSSGG